MKRQVLSLVALFGAACGDGQLPTSQREDPVDDTLDGGSADAGRGDTSSRDASIDAQRVLLDASLPGSTDAAVRPRDASVPRGAVKCRAAFDIERVPGAGAPALEALQRTVMSPLVTMLEGGTARFVVSYYAQTDTQGLPPGPGPVSAILELGQDCAVRTRRAFAPAADRAGLFVHAMTTGPAGTTALLATSSGSYDLGVVKTHDEARVLLMLNAALDTRWARELGDLSTLHDVGVDDAGNSYVLLSAKSGVDLGGGALQGTGDVNAERDAFLVKYDQAGAHVWSKRLLLGGTDWRLRVDSQGGIFVAATLREVVLEADPVSAGLQGMGLLVARLDTNGTLRWNRLLPIDRYNSEQSVALDPLGKLWVRFRATGILDEGGSVETRVFSAQGVMTTPWAREWGRVGALALDPRGDVLFAYNATEGSATQKWTSTGEPRWQLEGEPGAMFPANVGRAIAIGSLGEVATATLQRLNDTRVQVELLDP